MPQTRRQEITELLHHGALSVEEIAARVAADAKSVLADLEHVRRSLKPPESWRKHAAACLRCDFEFTGRDRFTTPSRCPKCRSEEIRDPLFEVVGE